MSSLKVATSKDENWWSRCWKVVKGDDEGVCESDCEGGCDKQTDKLTDILTLVIVESLLWLTIFSMPSLPQYHQSLITRNTTCYTGYISIQDCDGSGLTADVKMCVLISPSINHPYCIDAGWDCCCHEPISFIHTTTTISFISVILNTVQWQCST